MYHMYMWWYLIDPGLKAESLHVRLNIHIFTPNLLIKWSDNTRSLVKE